MAATAEPNVKCGLLDLLHRLDIRGTISDKRAALQLLAMPDGIQTIPCYGVSTQAGQPAINDPFAPGGPLIHGCVGNETRA